MPIRVIDNIGRGSYKGFPRAGASSSVLRTKFEGFMKAVRALIYEGDAVPLIKFFEL
ncbi:hypothetical protein [Pyrococcus kukulkanii]|uniref:Uncharacterized protein n=1 Tax=Pyrococcus kukulkanii TaxID=1609559 RepID=A0ABV4T659_9EURY